MNRSKTWDELTEEIRRDKENMSYMFSALKMIATSPEARSMDHSILAAKTLARVEGEMYGRMGKRESGSWGVDIKSTNDIMPRLRE